jgi:hypothetical protein
MQAAGHVIGAGILEHPSRGHGFAVRAHETRPAAGIADVMGSLQSTDFFSSPLSQSF